MSWESHYRDVRTKEPLVWPDINVIRQISKLSLPHSARILDLGCGEGRNTRALLEMGYDLLDVMDQSQSALAIVTNRYRLPDEQCHCAQIPEGLVIFEDQRFDAVLCWGLTHYLDDPLPTLKAIHRVLKPGHGLVISFSAKEDKRETVDTVKRYYNKKEIEQLLHDAGFTIGISGKHTDEFYSAGKVESFYWLTAFS
ncbi:class I SAM-dependent DNA methyltransferase [Shewanella sp.]|uniref:class I SAM-dependent DNA methyltransferase n=1 Tax=Shewanella sp. TaxID=50422 RepID=UPI003A97A484